MNSSHFIPNLLTRLQAKKWVLSQFRNPPRNTGSLNPKKIHRFFQPDVWTVDGFTALTIQGNPVTQKHVIFLPGGAYLLEATTFHRKFAEKVAKASGLSVTLIDYPKSPEHTYRTTHEILRKIFQSIRDRFPDQEVCLMGDSAGGGLALALLQTLRDQKVDPLPSKSVLISPWLDLSLSHPQISAYLSRDPILPLEGLEYAAALFAGGEDLRNPLLSPLFGDLHDLGEILLITGSEEIFFPDCQEFRKKVAAARGTEIEWENGESLIHAWPIFPFPESKQALERIVNFLLKG